MYDFTSCEFWDCKGIKNTPWSSLLLVVEELFADVLTEFVETEEFYLSVTFELPLVL